MTDISKQWVGSGQIDENSILLSNTGVLKAENAASSGTVGILQVNASDRILFSSVPQVAADPASGNDLVRSSYVSSTYQALSARNAANGYAGLDSSGKIALSAISTSVWIYKGTWNASTNSPHLSDSAVAASLVVQDITYTAVAAGAAGNLITIAYTGGGTAGSEIVSVSSTAISVQIQSGVSTATQVAAAVNAYGAATALISLAITGTGSHAQTTASATALAGGQDQAVSGSTYLASAAGSQNLGSGLQSWLINDVVLYNGSVWEHVPAAMVLPPTTRYIDFNLGSDSLGNGSEGLPWKTLQHAYNTITDASVSKPYTFYLSGGNNDTDSGTITAKPNINLTADYLIQIPVPFTISGVQANDVCNFNNISFTAQFTWIRNESVYQNSLNLFNCTFADGFTFEQSGAGGAFVTALNCFFYNSLWTLSPGGVFTSCDWAGTAVFNDTANSPSAPYYEFIGGYSYAQMSISGGVNPAYFAGMLIDVPFGATLTAVTTGNGTPTFQADSASLPAVITGSPTLVLESQSKYTAYVPTTSGNWASVPATVFAALDDVALASNTSSASKTGVLSSTDWSTFNGKQAALGFTAENVANKTTDGTLGGGSPSTALYPTESAIQTYVAAAISGISSANPQQEVLTLSSGDISAGYKDLAYVALNSIISLFPAGGPQQVPGVDYTLSTVSSKTRITFAGTLASTLIAGNVIVASYLK